MNPLLLARLAIAAAVFAAGAGAGWQLNGWRLNSKIADLHVQLSNAETRIAILEPANAKCAIDVGDVRRAFADLKAAEVTRAAEAKAALARAEASAKTFADAANRIMNLPRPAAGQECQAIIAEERDYVDARQKR